MSNSFLKIMFLSCHTMGISTNFTERAKIILFLSLYKWIRCIFCFLQYPETDRMVFIIRTGFLGVILCIQQKVALTPVFCASAASNQSVGIMRYGRNFVLSRFFHRFRRLCSPPLMFTLLCKKSILAA